MAVLLAGPHNAKFINNQELSESDNDELFPDGIIAKYWLMELDQQSSANEWTDTSTN